MSELNKISPAVLQLCLKLPGATSLLSPESDVKVQSVSFKDYSEAVAAVGLDGQQTQQCLELLLLLFNAENFTGMITDDEFHQVAELMERLDAGTTIRSTGNVKQGRGQGIAELSPSQFRALKLFEHLLTVDGEMPVPCLRLRGVLLAIVALAGTLPDTSIWRLRSYFRWQLSLSHRAHTLYQKCLDSLDMLAKIEQVQQSPLLLVELGHVAQYFHRSEEAGKLFFHAVKVSGLEMNEAAILGVRTRFQTISHAQSVLLATSARTPDELPSDKLPAMGMPMPKVIGSFKDGHDLYDRPIAEAKGTSIGTDVEASGIGADLSDAERQKQREMTEVSPLHHDDVVIILALCANIKNTNPYHGLTKHHIRFYVERLVVNPSTPVWILSAMTLLLRARMEQQANRVQERAFLQLQECIDQFGAVGHVSAPATLYRAHSKFVYAVPWPAIWTLKKEMSFECLDLSLVKTALELNEEIQDWEGVIDCCTKLDRRKKAESLISDLLKTDPDNIRLLVALGDATREECHLWKAWELCEGTMAAPMRSLAKLALERQQYDKVLEYFDKAVAINPLFGGDWFSLGFAAIRTKHFARASEAFTRACQIDPNDCYAWANLGSVLLQAGQKRAAYNAMSQALRNNRRSWQFWDNYFHVGLEVKEITEAMLALDTALSLAGIRFQLDDSAMAQFTDLALQYLRGDIKGTENDLEEVVKDIPHCRFEGTAAEDKLASVNNNAVAEEDDDDAEMWATIDLEPLAAGLELPESFQRREEEKKKEAAAVLASEARSRERFIDRLQQVLLRLTDHFVTNAQLFTTCAEVFGYLHGPRKEYEYRVSELRASQTPAWERSDITFEAGVKVLSNMATAAMAIPEVEEKNAATASAEGDEEQSKGDEGKPEEKKEQRDPWYPSRNTLQLVEHALKVSKDHMEDHVMYRKLKGLAKRLMTAIPKQ